MKIIVENNSFNSAGHALLGRVYRPDAAGRFPVVALYPGFPEDEKNTDLAEEMAFNGTRALGERL